MIRCLMLFVMGAVICTAVPSCSKHAFEPGDRVKRKFHPTISGVIGLRSNINGKGDVYWIFYRNQEGKKESDGPLLPEEIERVN
jgi:hypothetical protein